MMAPASGRMTNLLRHVSRSFYLTLRVLPGAIRPQISLAYLLARAGDTIADTQLVPMERRRAALQELRAAIRQAADGRSGPLPDFGALAAAQSPPVGEGSPGERELLERIGDILQALQGFSAADRALIREVLDTIMDGQEMDLAGFGLATVHMIAALDSDAELDKYTYRVAGCVGEFWTKMCRTHLFPLVETNEALLLARAVRFGKGLQLVNILRDIPRDLRRGRCYLPGCRLEEQGLAVQDLLDPAAMERFRPLFDGYLQLAEAHLDAGRAYTDALPRSQVRLRLACRWPLLIGLRTLELLRSGNVLDDRHRIKVSRKEIRLILLKGIINGVRP